MSEINRLKRGFAAWRRLGPRRGTAAAARSATTAVRGQLGRTRVSLAPPRASRRAVAAALGDAEPATALRGRALPALPTVGAWERELEGLSSPARAELIARAKGICGHRFNLLGSGPVDLGPEIDWQLDFKSGYRWPDKHISRVPIVLAQGADIKVPWELGRCQHLPMLAAAHRASGDRRFLDEMGAQLTSFISANPVGVGAQWACTMDVAIRATNWVAALCLAMPAASAADWMQPVLGSLLLHCRFIRSHLEWGEVRGNHYLSDVVGLLVACSPFTGSRYGAAWAGWAVRELQAEIFHQVREDGCDHEASIPYHRLVTELFICGTAAADALCPGALSAEYRDRLERMLEFVTDYTRPDGMAPQIGDADDGRFLPLGTYGSDPRDHRHLFAQAGRPVRAGSGHAAYPRGGYYVMRNDGLWCLVRCGDVGLYGVGAHAHNDQLSFELAANEQPLIIDPGSYVYTPDAAARNEFRSTRAHSTVSVGGSEQNPLRTDYLFSLSDETQARCRRFESAGSRATFEGEHAGFRSLGLPIRHRRELQFDGDAATLIITDTVFGAAGREIEWAFPLAPTAVELDRGRAMARFGAVELEIVAEELELELDQGWIAPSYGVRLPSPVVRARRVARSAEDVARYVIKVRRTSRP